MSLSFSSTISANYYNCTDEILAGLGKMYVGDKRFKKNIDKHGDGTAEFVAQAVAIYTKETRGVNHDRA